MIPTLETPRLVLRPMEVGDAEQIQPLFDDWEIVKYLNALVPWPYPPDGARRWLESAAIPAMERGESWHWTLRLKTDATRVIGAIGLTRGGEDNRGFWIGRPWQGRGLMTEAVIAVTDYWFHDLGFSLLRVPKALANLPSRRISEKTGMRCVASFERDYVSGRLPAQLWEITAEEWRAYREPKRRNAAV
jgi:RimJ/RimL family protein N-acetyltransferase